MSGFKVYQDLAERTNVEFYLGVCVRFVQESLHL